MGISKKQAELIGVFNGLPTPQINDYYLKKFTQNHLTIGESIKYDELTDELIVLGIIPRNSKAPIVTVNGFTRSSVKPDIIAAESTLTAGEILEIQAGQVDTIVNGQVVNNAEAIKQRHLTRLKTGWYNTMSRMAAEVFLTGKVALEKSGDEIDYGIPAVVDKSVKESEVNYYTLLHQLATEYEKEQGVAPTDIEIDMSLFNKMLQNDSFLEQTKVFNMASVGRNDDQIVLNVLGYNVKVLKPAVNVKGETIDTTNMIYISNNQSLIKGFAGLVTGANGRLDAVKTDLLVTEIVNTNPATQSILFESAFLPIIPLPNRIKRVKIKLTK